MHRHDATSKRRLSEGPLGIIETCRCGTLTIHVGPVSMRLDESALEPLAHMFAEAVIAQRAEKKRERDDVALFLGRLPHGAKDASEVVDPKDDLN